MKNHYKIFFSLLVLALVAAPTLSAMTVDELVAKNLEARGGADAWAKVESMTLTGNFTAFSKTGTFTMHRTHENKMRVEYSMIGQPVVVGYDGEIAWQQSPLAGPWPDQPSGVERTQILQDVEFVNPLYHWKKKGYELTLVGETKIDGMAAIQVDVKRPDESEESWYFDPETYLEIARDGVGADMGTQSFPLRTVFDDFREVGGVKVPYWVETEWYTRHRVFEVENVEVNPEVDAALFGLPVSTGMENLQGMAGTWDVKVELTRRPGAPATESRASSTIETHMNGALIVEHYRSENVETMGSLSYDPFKETYRMTLFNDQRPYPNVLEGAWDEESGKLSLNNAETDTSFSMFGQVMHGGWSIGEVTEDGFVVEQSISRDGGENWFNNVRMTYAKPGTLDDAAGAAAEGE